MLLAYLTLFAGLSISAVAEFYSIMGLIAIYPAAFWPIVIMGGALGLGKLTGTVWLKQNWYNAPAFLKTYLLPAVVVLMMITSIGVFGFLSKAHSDQSLVSGDVQSKISIYDEKIKTARENIEADRKAIKQMDEAVDQVMARSTSEGGADKANAIRKSQQRDRSSLAKDIEAQQKIIAQLNDEAAPIRAEVRKVEAEVGPIKYIAAFIYGNNPDANLLEKAVTWVSILIVIVLDPMAVIMLLASQYSFEYERKKRNPGLEIFAGKADIEMTEPEEEEQPWHFFDKARNVARRLDEQSYVAPIVPPTGPITSWTTTNYEPNEDTIAAMKEAREMAEHRKEAEEFPFRGKGAPISVPMTASYMQPKYEADTGPLTDKQVEQIRKMAKDELPTGELITRDSLFEEAEIEEGQYVQLTKEWADNIKDLVKDVEVDLDQPLPEETIITHTAEGITIEDAAGKSEITMGPNVSAIGNDYLSVDGQMYHHRAYDPKSKNAQEVVDRLNSTYVQNEEQKEGGLWSKIANKPISEEEYLKASQTKQHKDE